MIFDAETYRKTLKNRPPVKIDPLCHIIFLHEMEKKRELEIVGLLVNSNGRSCCAHETCGTVVNEGDVLRLKKCIVTTSPNSVKEAIRCVRIVHGVESCIVAYVPRSLMNHPAVIRNINGYVQVIELYSTSTNSMKRWKSHQNRGIGGCIFLESIPIGE